MRIVFAAPGLLNRAPEACQPAPASSWRYCPALTLDQTTATTAPGPAQVSVGTAFGSGTPEGRAPPRWKWPSEFGNPAQVIGRSGRIAVIDPPDGDTDDCDTDDRGPPPAGEPVPDDAHPPRAATATAAAATPASGPIT